jgi:HEAT repeat protein
VAVDGLPGTEAAEEREAENDSAENLLPVNDLADSSLVSAIIDYSISLERRLGAIHEAGMRKLTDAVPPLIESLYDPEPAVSSAAAESLGAIGDARAIEPLMDIARTLDAKLLEGAPAGFAPAEPPPTNPEEGEQSSTSKEMVVANPFKYKELTTFRLDLLPKEYFQPDGSPIPRKELVSKGLRDTDQQLRKMAAKAAIGLDDAELVEPLSEVLHNPYEVESVRYLAAEALGGISDDRSLNALVEALNDENIAVRYSAAAAIGQFHSEGAVLALKKALTDPNEFVRSSVAYALGQINRPEALDALFGAIDDRNEVVRFSIAKALGSVGGEKVVAGLETRFRDSDRRLRLGAIEALAQVKDPRAIKLLREALRDPDSEISFQASLALMDQESIEALDELIDVTRRMDRELMDWLKTGKPAKGSSEEREAQEGGDSFFQSSSSPAVHGQAAAVSGEALDKLEEALHGESPNVRGCAANALGDFQDARAETLLVKALGDPHEYVRSTAVSSLAKRQNPETLGSLLKLSQDSSEDVRYALAKGLALFPRDSRVIFILNQMAEKDVSKDVKRIARKELERLEAETPST